MDHDIRHNISFSFNEDKIDIKKIKDVLKKLSFMIFLRITYLILLVKME